MVISNTGSMKIETERCEGSVFAKHVTDILDSRGTESRWPIARLVALADLPWNGYPWNANVGGF